MQYPHLASTISQPRKREVPQHQHQSTKLSPRKSLCCRQEGRVRLRLSVVPCKRFLKFPDPGFKSRCAAVTHSPWSCQSGYVSNT